MPKGSRSHFKPGYEAIRANGGDGAVATVNGLTRAQLEAQLASAIERRCWWAENAIRADLRKLEPGGELAELRRIRRLSHHRGAR